MAGNVSMAVCFSDGAIIQKPCAFNPNGATWKSCQDMSVVPRHNARCCSIQCPSRARICKACAFQGGEKKTVVNIATGLCTFHQENGEAKTIPVQRFKPISNGMRGGGGSVAVAKLPNLGASEPDSSKDSGLSLEKQAALTRARKAIAEAAYQEISPKLIRRNPDQPRKQFDPEALELLRQGIQQDGQLQPGLVRPVSKDKDGTIYEVVDGERRWRAVSNIKGRKYRAFVAHLDDEAAAYLMSVALNCNRVEHTHLEISDAIVYMSETLHMRGEDIGKTMGLHEVVVSQYKSLRRIVPEVRRMFDPEQSGIRRFPFQAAVSLSRIKPELQEYYAQQYIEGKVSNVALKQLSLSAEHRSDDVMSVRVPDIWEQWRAHASRMEGISKKLEEHVGLIERTRHPAYLERPLTGRASAITHLRKIKALAEQGLRALKADS